MYYLTYKEMYLQNEDVIIKYCNFINNDHVQINNILSVIEYPYNYNQEIKLLDSGSYYQFLLDIDLSLKQSQEHLQPK